ncbi:MAG: hypothetical protein JXA93_09355, partial [Anaerolineae bacterium]|nr:hypothetical protein [Anaerolineae bacterium]
MDGETRRHNLGALRELLLSTFTVQDLRRFCHDRPLLAPVELEFSPNHGLADLVDRVITFCEKRRLLDTLLLEIQVANPAQYAYFEPRLALPARVLAASPYRGLQPFEAEHASLFFGRDAMIAQLVKRVRACPFIAVVGASGCGKSSLVRAGLVPALCNEAASGSPDWSMCLFRPGPEPLHALAASLVDLLEPDAGEVTRLAQARSLAQALGDSTIALADVSARLCARPPTPRRLLLVADQFEEVFTECRDPAQRQRLIAALLAAGTGATVVLTLRADFYGHVLADRHLAEAVDAGLVNVLPMSRDEMRTAVEQPAFGSGGAFEAGLVDRILDDVEGQPGSLPLVQFALTELWARATSQGLLTHAAYEAIGQVEGAIARRAEAVYETLDAQGHAAVVRGVFMRLAHYGAGMEGTRRRAALPDLATPGMPAVEVERVVDALAGARLVVTGQDTLAGSATVEVSHEALIRGWGRLRTWLDADRAFGLWRDKLAAARRAWLDAAQDEGALLRGAPLSEAEGWLADRGDDLNEAERAYIQAGLALREREAAEEREQQRKEAQLVAEQRAAGRLRHLAIALAGLFVLALALAGLAAWLWGDATEQRDLARIESQARATARMEAVDEARARATAQADAEVQRDQAQEARIQADGLKLAFASLGQIDTNQELALLLAIECARTAHSFEADSALRAWFLHAGHSVALLSGHEGPVSRAAWDSEGRRIVTASEDGTARVWDASTGQALAVLRGHQGPLVTAAWDGQGRRLVTASEDGTARLWDADTGQALAVLRGHEGRVWHAAWDPEGRRIVTCGDDATARVWDAGTGQVLAVLRGHQDWVAHAAWDGDGRRIVTASSDGTARVWDAETGRETAVLRGHESTVVHAAWDGQGSRIVTASWDNTARVWDADTGQALAVLRGHEDWLWHAAWDGEGRRIVTAGDTTARIWDASTGQALAVLRGHEEWVTDAAWDPGGRHLATASWDHTARLWDAETGQALAVLRGHEGPVVHATWDAEGGHIVTASRDGTARVWAAATGQELPVLRGHE